MLAGGLSNRDDVRKLEMLAAEFEERAGVMIGLSPSQRGTSR